ncbi:MAG: class I SAM-dependent methyltransferase [Dehalococcoidia bacterium]|nr:MAG: class I SAM-dependent methyltransferase [Dehalococcoidia bacterium]
MVLESKYNPLSDLWRGEQIIVAEIASLVPDNGTIVEIGTFQGGTTQILHAATHKRGVKTYTVDIAPPAMAYENLKNTDVEIIARPSVEAAKKWTNSIGRPIDLLFIDGSHRFQSAFEDFNSWVGLLKPGGTVIFHDHDPVERGGLVHFGVQICADTILRLGLMKEPKHRYKLLYGIIESPDVTQLDVSNCAQTFAELGRQIVHLRDFDYSDWTLVADDKFALLLEGCLKLQGCNGPMLPAEANEPNRKYLVSAHPLGMPPDLLAAQGIPRDDITVIDSLKACYFVDHALETNFDYLYKISANPAEFWRWAETLGMINHVYGKSFFPDRIQEQMGKISAPQLSKLITKEQIKLNMLARLIKTFVDWTP